MTKTELDEYIAKYGYDNETDIPNTAVAMAVHKKRRDKENANTIRTERAD